MKRGFEIDVFFFLFGSWAFAWLFDISFSMGS
jgi:hypothetical protein